VKVTVAVWVSEPEFPVIVTVYEVWGLPPLQLSVWLPDPPVMLVLVNEHERPVGVTDDESVTAPVKPKFGVTVIVEEPVAPGMTGTEAGLAEIVKS